MTENANDKRQSDIPGNVGKPAQRALAAAGYVRLEQLAGVREDQVRQLHGVGPKAMERLQEALAARGCRLPMALPNRLGE